MAFNKGTLKELLRMRETERARACMHACVRARATWRRLTSFANDLQITPDAEKIRHIAQEQLGNPVKYNDTKI